ncbi:MAG: flagellar basal body rod protein FlgF [Gammaproteobacteria bacterium]|nr:flagellar basal body rod protein FlgF [Gammaproteobacteria bacterium]MDH5629586.1 flagellar basal body rod protein FlgF [Gammaproteobacteria bacterium]
MDNLLYISMTGARETTLAQATVANNLANANTTGFKADFSQFRAMPVYGEGHPSRAFAMTEKPGYDFSSGSVMTTGRDLDVTIQDQGWLVVLDEQGNEALSRRGDLQVTADGELVNGSQQSIVGDGGPMILPPFEKIEIGRDGTVTVLPLGAEANAIAVVGRIKLVNPEPENLVKNSQGLFVDKDGQGFEADASVSLQSGMLEGSNVSVVESLTEMITLSRQFELQVKLMSSVEERGRALDRLLQP